MNQKDNNSEISFTWDKESGGYYKRHKLSNGQFCQIAFYRWNGSRSTEYHVAFAVADKKKNLNGWFNQTKDDNLTLRATGRCGVEALFWARDMLLEFEKYIFLREIEDTKIVVQGEDSRRFRLYERALSRYGYRKVKFQDGWEMVKFIEHKKRTDAAQEEGEP